METIIDVWLKPRVDVTIIEFTIENQENRIIVDKRSNGFSLWPFRFGVEHFGILVPSTLICNGYFCEVVVKNGLVEVGDELSICSGKTG